MNIRKRGNTYCIILSLGLDSNGKRIRQYVTFNPDPRAVLMIYLLSSTGMREGEAAGLKWQDCDFENRLIRIIILKNRGVHHGCQNQTTYL